MHAKNKNIFHKTILSPKMAPYILVLPFLISFFMFFIYPLLSTIQMSFQDINGFNDVRYNGINNYKALLNERFCH